MGFGNINNIYSEHSGSFALYESPTSYMLFNENDFSYCNSKDCNNNRCMRNQKNRWFKLAQIRALEEGDNFIFSRAEFSDVCRDKNKYNKVSDKIR